jgi:hypothetical protein
MCISYIVKHAIAKQGFYHLIQAQPSKNILMGEAMVAYTYNPSYSGGRNKDHGSQDPISKNPSQKRAGGVAQAVGPEFMPQNHTHTQKKTF